MRKVLVLTSAGPVDAQIWDLDDTITLGPVSPSDSNQQIRQTVAEVDASAGQAATSDGPVVRMFRNFLVNHIVHQTGADASDVRQAVAQVEATSGHPLLDWLKNGGFATLVKLVLEILAIVPK